MSLGLDGSWKDGTVSPGIILPHMRKPRGFSFFRKGDVYTMRSRLGGWVLALGLAISLAGCGSPPTAAIDAAKAALNKATAAGAERYAAASFKAAQEAEADLEAELKAQDEHFLKSYSKAAELAQAAETAGRDAATDAEIEKIRAKKLAQAGIEETKKAITEAQGLLAKAPRSRGSAPDVAALKNNLSNASQAIADAETALGGDHFLQALAKVEAARKTATDVKSAVEVGAADTIHKKG
jgi:hypothetical protein